MSDWSSHFQIGWAICDWQIGQPICKLARLVDWTQHLYTCACLALASCFLLVFMSVKYTSIYLSKDNNTQKSPWILVGEDWGGVWSCIAVVIRGKTGIRRRPWQNSWQNGEVYTSGIWGCSHRPFVHDKTRHPTAESNISFLKNRFFVLFFYCSYVKDSSKYTRNTGTKVK